MTELTARLAYSTGRILLGNKLERNILLKNYSGVAKFSDLFLHPLYIQGVSKRALQERPLAYVKLLWKIRVPAHTAYINVIAHVQKDAFPGL